MACAFTDKLSAEIRIMIYGYTFYSSDVVRRAHESKSDISYNRSTGLGKDGYIVPRTKRPAHTAICAVNRKSQWRGQRYFYKLKTIRGSPRTLMLTMSNPDFIAKVKRIQVTDYVSGHKKDRLDKQFEPFIEQALNQLSRLQLLSILTDYARTFSGHPSGAGEEPDSGLTARDILHLSDLPLAAGLRCVEIGRYTCSPRVEVINTKLLKMWPHLRWTPSDYDVMVAIDQVLEDWGCPHANNRNVICYALQTSLRCWVGLYRIMTEARNPTDKAAVFSRMTLDLIGRLGALRGSMLHLGEKVPQFKLHSQGSECITALRELSPGLNADILEWATKLISANIAASHYSASDVHTTTNYLVLSFWKELEGGDHYGREYIDKTEEVVDNYHEPGTHHDLRSGKRLAFPHAELEARTQEKSFNEMIARYAASLSFASD